MSDNITNDAFDENIEKISIFSIFSVLDEIQKDDFLEYLKMNNIKIPQEIKNYNMEKL